MSSCTALTLRRLALPCVALCLLGASPLLRADDHDHGSHELARQALEQGRVLPLRTVLDKVEKEYSGQVVELEFEAEHGEFVYEIRLLQANGTLLKIKMNAVDGSVISVKQRNQH